MIVLSAVLRLWYVVAVHLCIPDPRDILEERGWTKICKGHDEYVGEECVIRALRTAVFLLSPSAVLPVPTSLTPYSRVSTRLNHRV